LIIINGAMKETWKLLTINAVFYKKSDQYLTN